MVSAEAQKPLCPVCHQADKVKTLQAVYNEGLERFAAPPMPGKTVSMVRYMVVSMLIVGVCIFFILILVGSESFGQQAFSWAELALVLLTLICIVAALILSYVAFTKVVHGDMEAQKRYAAWDQAMQNWNRLRYCARDDVVFDPQTGKTVSQEALSSLLSTDVKEEEQVAQSSASAVHQ